MAYSGLVAQIGPSGSLQTWSSYELRPTKKAPDPGAIFVVGLPAAGLLRSRIGRRGAGRLGGLELLARFFGALLQLFLQLLLGFLEHLRVGRRTVIGLGEFAPAAAAASAARRWS